MSSRQSRPHNNTLRMEVKNMGFLIDRLGEDCALLQFLRELTQNSIEAILALPNRSGEIRWDVDWNTHELAGVYKLAIVDTAVGMTGQEMEQYINNHLHLSFSSIRPQSTCGNYGVGAKIAAAPRNRAGLIYLSWKGGVGHQIWLWRDPETNEYGLRKFDWPDGTASCWAHVDDDIKPEPIKDHGTMVVLFGNSDDEDTMIPPEGTPVPSGWVLRYLNSRYYEVPEEIVVHAREGWENSRKDTRHNLLRQVTGVKSYLERSAMVSGRVSLTEATAYWWILKTGEQADTADRYIPNGHIGALYQNVIDYVKMDQFEH